MQRGPAQGPVQQGGPGIDINTQQVPGLPPQQASPQLNTYQQGNGRDFGGLDQQQFLRMLMERFGPQMMQQQQYALETQRGAQVRPEEQFQAAAKAQDPLRYAQQTEAARMATSPWAPGGQFDKGYHLNPTAALASQGNNATNQWAQRGGMVYGGEQIDPEELKRLNASRGNRTYM
jgi:hypothetical protein